MYTYVEKLTFDIFSSKDTHISEKIAHNYNFPLKSIFMNMDEQSTVYVYVSFALTVLTHVKNGTCKPMIYFFN